MAVGLRFVQTGAKRVVDSRPMYAQVVVTDDCNLTCSYCDEYTPGEIQTVLNDDTYATYDYFRAQLGDLPFAFGVSIMHGPGGQIAIRGQKFIDLPSKYGVFEGVNFYPEHLKEMLEGDFSRPWKCLAGFKFLYVNAKGNVQWCAQQRDYAFPLAQMTPRELGQNDRHKPCEGGCSLGCVRMVSHTLGEPLRTLGASLSLALKMRR